MSGMGNLDCGDIAPKEGLFMPRKYKFTSAWITVLTLALSCVLVSSCGTKNKGAAPSGPSASSLTPVPTPTPTPSPTPADPIQQRVARMTLDEKIGQMVLVGLEGTSMQSHAREMIETYRVTGFILYKYNITGHAQTETLLNQLKEANRNNAFPLWLGVDQEGGRVDRFPAEFVKMPSAQEIGRSNKPEYAYQIGQALGAEVRSLGFNMDFAPVLDVNSNPNNPVIGDRSFGADPETVIKHGLQVMKGIQSKQIVPVVKHFPGHGDTSVDSHLDLPVIHKSLEELRSFELKPFAEAVKEQTDAVMVGHLLLPKIDATNPASLSAEVITNLLRKEMTFDGVVITDDLTMGGITKHADTGEAAVKSVLAGSDILLVGHDYEQQVSVLTALKKRVQDGTISEKRLEESVYRIARLKAKYGVQDTSVSDVDVNAVNRQIEAALNSSPS
jgi:beta-N-acetylhexosaminidase